MSSDIATKETKSQYQHKQVPKLIDDDEIRAATFGGERRLTIPQYSAAIGGSERVTYNMVAKAQPPIGYLLFRGMRWYLLDDLVCLLAKEVRHEPPKVGRPRARQPRVSTD
jgi:hypothetical protein